MNGKIFMNELKLQVEAVKAIGNTSINWGVSYKMYNESEQKLLDFIKRNKTNIISCLDVVFNDMWISNDDRCNEFIALYESGDYDDALGILGYVNVWRFRRELEHLEITIY